MAMSRKHYREAAEILRNRIEFAQHLTVGERTAVEHAVTQIAYRMAGMFRRDNPSFSTDRFMDAVFEEPKVKS